MSTEGHFHELAWHVRDLLESGAVGFLLGCPDVELRHPLLELLPRTPRHYAGYYGSTEVVALLDDERVRALCDGAVQTGRVQCSANMQICIKGAAFQSIAVVPLERPAGVLGLLLLVDPRVEAFRAGERLLLEGYVSLVGRDLEKTLRDLHYFSRQQPAGASPRAALAPLQQAPGQREVDRLKSEFISMVSHELRTPLTAIKGYAGLLQAYSVPAVSTVAASVGTMTIDLQQQYLDIIMEQANHLEVLASDLLDVSRIHADRLVLRFVAVEMAPLCQQIVQMTQQRVDEQSPGKYYIRCMLDPDLPPAWADADRVQQVLDNLLENAVKYSPDGGLIEVQARLPRASLSSHNGQALSWQDLTQASSVAQGPLMMYVSVRDQGIGISLEQQSRLFKPFSRLEHPATNHVTGAGLGLYITRKLVAAMGGTIVLQSNEGEGTRVTFTLPVLSPYNPC